MGLGFFGLDFGGRIGSNRAFRPAGPGPGDGGPWVRAPRENPTRGGLSMGSRVLLLLGMVALMAGITTADEPDDPFLWLEDVMGDRALAWVRERNSESTAELAGAPAFRELEGRILSVLDSDAKIPMISKVGPHYYNFWKDAKHKRGLWRRTTLDEYRKAEPGLGDRGRPRRPRRESEKESTGSGMAPCGRSSRRL